MKREPLRLPLYCLAASRRGCLGIARKRGEYLCLRVERTVDRITDCVQVPGNGNFIFSADARDLRRYREKPCGKLILLIRHLIPQLHPHILKFSVRAGTVIPAYIVEGQNRLLLDDKVRFKREYGLVAGNRRGTCRADRTGGRLRGDPRRLWKGDADRQGRTFGDAGEIRR